jgi:hypothetical protein
MAASDASERVLVAPREIADLVDRASRVQGCSVADAARLAADVTFCEIHHGGGLTAWLELADGPPGGLVGAIDAARTLDRWALDILEGARAGEPGATGGAVEHRWAGSVPYALLARSQAALAQHGVAVDIAADRGTDQVAGARLRVVAATDRPDDERRRRDALAHGVGVDRAAWAALAAAAAAFLMPEAELDAAAAP